MSDRTERWTFTNALSDASGVLARYSSRTVVVFVNRLVCFRRTPFENWCLAHLNALRYSIIQQSSHTHLSLKVTCAAAKAILTDEHNHHM